MKFKTVWLFWAGWAVGMGGLTGFGLAGVFHVLYFFSGPFVLPVLCLFYRVSSTSCHRAASYQATVDLPMYHLCMSRYPSPWFPVGIQTFL